MGGIFSTKQIHTMLDQKEDHERKILQFFRKLRNWKLCLILLPLLFLAATFLRLDHIHMTELRDRVLAADAGTDINATTEGEISGEFTVDLPQEEIDKNIASTLFDLKNFTDHHIVVNFIERNGVSELVFGTGQFYLEGQYHRKAALAIARAEEIAATLTDDNPNGNVFATAMSICQPQAHQNGWAWNSPAYISCYNDVINSFPTQDALTTSVTADIPTTALFRYDYTSPVWYPSLSGFTILICFILLITILVRAIWWIILQIALRLIKD